MATTPEPESMTWLTGGPHLYAMAQNIVQWVKDGGGDARYQYSAKPETLGLIVIIGPNGPIYAKPGDTIAKGSEWFQASTGSVDLGGLGRVPTASKLREFTVSSPEATT